MCRAVAPETFREQVKLTEIIGGLQYLPLLSGHLSLKNYFLSPSVHVKAFLALQRRRSALLGA